jgi:hypothetical protein
MRELEERENRAGYQDELEERLALAGCSVAKRRIASRAVVDQVDADDEDLDEDELEDEELEDQVPLLEDPELYEIARRLGGEPPPAPRKE